MKRDELNEAALDHVWTFYAPHQVWICQTCGVRHDKALVVGGCSGTPPIPNMTATETILRHEAEKHTQREKCGRGEHEAQEGMRIVVHPSGSYIYAEDRLTRQETTLRMCRHCRSVYVPR